MSILTGILLRDRRSVTVKPGGNCVDLNIKANMVVYTHEYS